MKWSPTDKKLFKKNPQSLLDTAHRCTAHTCELHIWRRRERKTKRNYKLPNYCKLIIQLILIFFRKETLFYLWMAWFTLDVVFTRKKIVMNEKKREKWVVWCEWEKRIFIFIRLPCLPTFSIIFYYEILSGKFIKIFPPFLRVSFMAFPVASSSLFSAVMSNSKLSVAAVRMDVEKYGEWDWKIEREKSQWERWKFLSLNPHHHRRHPFAKRIPFKLEHYIFFFGAGTSPVDSDREGVHPFVLSVVLQYEYNVYMAARVNVCAFNNHINVVIFSRLIAFFFRLNDASQGCERERELTSW